MKKLLSIAIVFLLMTGMTALFAQTGGQQPSATQPSASSTQTSPSATDSGARTPANDQARPAQPSQPDRSSSSSSSSTTATQPPANNNAPRSAENRGGVPWLWIGIGVAVLIVILVALAARGSGTTTVVDRTVERHDDVRRVG